MIEHYSSKIQNVIQKELFKATKSIKIAVAWFTNDLLFQPLLMKLQTGVKVEIILNKDDINCSPDNDVNFDDFVSLGGVLRWNDSKQLLHDKFCIIDDNVVITGSYNWTNKAEYNGEVITLFRDDNDTVTFYNDLYKKLTSNFSCVKAETKSLNHVKRISDTSPIPFEWQKCAYREYVMPHDCEKDILISQYPELNFFDKVDLNSGFMAIDSSTNKMAVLDKQSGRRLTDFLFDDYRFYFNDNDKNSDNKIWLLQGGYWKLFDRSISSFISFGIYTTRRLWSHNIIMQNGKYTIINNKGEIFNDFIFDHISLWHRGDNEDHNTKAVLEKDGKYGLCDLEKDVYYPCEFREDEVVNFIKNN